LAGRRIPSEGDSSPAFGGFIMTIIPLSSCLPVYPPPEGLWWESRPWRDEVSHQERGRVEEDSSAAICSFRMTGILPRLIYGAPRASLPKAGKRIKIPLLLRGIQK